MAEMMIYQDGSNHVWISGLEHKAALIVTVDDVTSEVDSGMRCDFLLSNFKGEVERSGC